MKRQKCIAKLYQNVKYIYVSFKKEYGKNILHIHMTDNYDITNNMTF